MPQTKHSCFAEKITFSQNLVGWLLAFRFLICKVTVQE